MLKKPTCLENHSQAQIPPLSHVAMSRSHKIVRKYLHLLSLSFTTETVLISGLILAHDRKHGLGYRCSKTDYMSITLWINNFNLLRLIYLHTVSVSPHSHTAPPRKLWNHTKNTAINSAESQRDLRQSSPLRSAASLPCWRWQLLIRVWMQAGGGVVVTHWVMPGPHSQTKWTLAKGNLCVFMQLAERCTCTGVFTAKRDRQFISAF